MKSSQFEGFFKRPRRPGFYCLLLVLAFAAGHYSFFQLRSATAKIPGAFNSILATEVEVPTTQWVPEDADLTPLPAGTALVRDDGGAIQSIFITFDSTWTNVTAFLDDLFKKLPVEVQVQVGCTDAGSVDMFDYRWGQPEKQRGRQVTLLNAKRPLTLWARDRQIAMQGPQGKTRISLIPRPLEGSKITIQERVIPKLRLANGLVDRVGYIPFGTEGGNVAANGRHAFIGNNILEQNEETIADDNLLCQELESLFGRDVLLVRDYAGKVPHEHLDMYLTPMDNQNVLLADLAAGSELLKAQDGRKPLAAVNANPARVKQLEEVAELLKRQGYKVHRIPAIFHSDSEWMVTYNNCLMERRNGEKIVYMPIYHLPVLDKAAASVYREHGFRVETIDVSQVFRGRGALRCIANVTLRKPLEAKDK